MLRSLRGVRFAYNSPQTPHWWVKGGLVGAVGWVTTGFVCKSGRF